MQSNILVVDDDIGILQAIRITLEDEGYHVATAENGLVALEKVAITRPSLILLDMMMPKMDGVTFAHELTRSGRRGNLPIIVLTAGGRASQRAREIDATAYVLKPFDIDELLAVVAKYIPPPSRERTGFSLDRSFNSYNDSFSQGFAHQ